MQKNVLLQIRSCKITELLYVDLPSVKGRISETKIGKNYISISIVDTFFSIQILLKSTKPRDVANS